MDMNPLGYSHRQFNLCSIVEPSQMPTLRSETVNLAGNLGSLGIRGGNFEAALIVSGQITAFHWCDCRGSVGQNLVRSVGVNGLASVQLFRCSVEDEISRETTLASHFAVVLAVLEPGHYMLTLEDIPADSYTVEFSRVVVSELEESCFYPGFGAMVATQREPSMSSQRVEDYIRAIEAGARPTVITLSTTGAWSEFILDGHHKLKAYRVADVQIRRLAITRLDSQRLPLEDALQFLPEAGPLRQHLRLHRPKMPNETR
ncbi:MAG: hypothetical protein V4858_03580 [Pseudomonadota bacterium]